MKNFKTTWIFGALVIALAAYVFWDFTEQKRGVELGEGEVLINEFAPSEIQKLEISKNKGAVTIELEGGQCHITSPVKDLCDTVSVQSVLNTLTPLAGRKVMATTELDSKKSEFGLDDDEMTKISWTLKNGQSSSLKIGSKNTFDGSYYVLKENLYVAERAVGQLTNKGLDQLRNKKLWRGPEEVTSFSTGDFTLTLRDGQWTMQPSPESFEIDDERVTAWIQDVKRLEGTKVLDQKPDSISSTPVMEAKFNGQNYSLQILEGKGALYGTESETSRYVEIPRERLTKIIVPANYFYDGKAPFQFDLERVSQLSVSKGKEKLEFKKEEREWVYKGEKKGFDEDKLPLFFQDLKGLEAQTFAAAGNSFSAKGKITMMDSKEQVVYELTIGDDYRPKEGPFKGESLKLAKVKGYGQIFAAPKANLDKVLNFNFFENAAEPPAKESSEGAHHGHNH